MKKDNIFPDIGDLVVIEYFGGNGKERYTGYVKNIVSGQQKMKKMTTHEIEFYKRKQAYLLEDEFEFRWFRTEQLNNKPLVTFGKRMSNFMNKSFLKILLLNRKGYKYKIKIFKIKNN